MLTASTDSIRSWMLQFNKLRPAAVSQKVYDAMAKKPELADIMDRVKVQPAKPTK